MKIKVAGTVIFYFFSALTLAAEDISIADSRPLMGLCATLHERHGTLITYEDAPVDPVSETNTQTRPNGKVFRIPKSSPMTFHLTPDLPTRNELTDQFSSNTSAADSFEAIREAVEQYNSTDNPGRFSAHADGAFIHVQQTMRTINGRPEPFEPISDRTLSGWPSTTTASCQQILIKLFEALHTQYGTSVVEGSVPAGSLLTHSCKVTNTSGSIGKILEAVITGLGTKPGTEEKTVSYTWHLVYDPNWNKYFLNLYLVSTNLGPTMENHPQKNVTPTLNGRSQDRLGRQSE